MVRSAGGAGGRINEEEDDDDEEEDDDGADHITCDKSDNTSPGNVNSYFKRRMGDVDVDCGGGDVDGG